MAERFLLKMRDMALAEATTKKILESVIKKFPSEELKS